jgi:hypothetical protein
LTTEVENAIFFALSTNNSCRFLFFILGMAIERAEMLSKKMRKIKNFYFALPEAQ